MRNSNKKTNTPMTIAELIEMSYRDAFTSATKDAENTLARRFIPLTNAVHDIIRAALSALKASEIYFSVDAELNALCVRRGNPKTGSLTRQILNTPLYQEDVYNHYMSRELYYEMVGKRLEEFGFCPTDDGRYTFCMIPKSKNAPQNSGK